MADHPAEKTFAPFSIRGKKPGHPDHKDMSGHGSDAEHGGATGFNLEDDKLATGGGGASSAPTEQSQKTPPMDSGEVAKPSGELAGGIDFTVPPYRVTQ